MNMNMNANVNKNRPGNGFKSKPFFLYGISVLILLFVIQLISQSAGIVRPYELAAKNETSGVLLTFDLNPNSQYDNPNPDKIGLFRKEAKEKTYPQTPTKPLTASDQGKAFDVEAEDGKNYFYVLKELGEDGTYRFISNEVFISRLSFGTPSSSAKPTPTPAQSPIAEAIPDSGTRPTSTPTPKMTPAPFKVLTKEELSAGIQITLTINNPLMIVNDVPYEIDPGRGTVPIIRGGRTMVPIAPLIRMLGGQVSWSDKEKKVGLSYQSKTLSMVINKTVLSAMKNGKSKSVKMDVAPFIANERTFLPLRFLIEELGMSVTWEDATKTVKIKA